MGCATALIGLALAGTGAGLGVSAADSEGKAMNNAVTGDIQSMQRYTNKMEPLFQQALGKSTPESAQNLIGQGQNQFLTSAQKATNVAPGYANPLNNTNQSASNVRAQLGNQAMSNYAGISNLPLQWGVQNTTTWPQLGILNAQAQQRNALLPALEQMASRSQSGRAGLGQLVSGIGSLFGGLGSLGSLGSLGGSAQQPQQPVTDNTGFGSSWANPSSGNWSTGAF